MMGLYWHFVDIVWIFLFPFLYLIRSMTQRIGHHEAEASRTNEAFSHGNPIKLYLVVFIILLALLVVTFFAAQFKVPSLSAS
jgi:heme/copper-type cytochrome/quinol oxidase subunit 3